VFRTKRTRREQQPITPPELTPWTETPEWRAFRPHAADELTKLRAIRSYKSQLQGFGRLFVTQLTLFEWGRGGESVAWLTPR
jgi:hypothetical protein